MAVAYCSSKTCNHFSTFNTARDIKPEKYCIKCGEKMISACPNCDHYRKDMEGKFCYNCGKPYK